MHLRLVAKVLALFSIVVSLSMGWPLFWAIRDGTPDARSFTISMVLGATLSALLFVAGRSGNYREMGTKDGFLVVGLTWLVASLIGALPYYLHGCTPSFAGAFFEAVSGFTTTGATVLADIEACPRGILFWRSLTHWLGGMGIIVLSLALLPFLGVRGFALYKAEVPGPVTEKMTPRIHQTALYLWGIYMTLTLAESVFLMFGGMNFFESVTHSFSTIATGGFSPLNRSIGQYGSLYFETVITLFMFLSGVNFTLHYRFLMGDGRAFARDDEFRVYGAIIAVAVVAIAVDLTGRGVVSSVLEALRQSAFQVVSIITTTGFVTADFEYWPAFSQIVLVLLMLVGACAGSTGGGMKVVRFVILFRQAKAELRRILHPRAVTHIAVGGKKMEDEMVMSVAGFFILFTAVFTGGVLLLTALGLDLVSALSGVAATLGNVGPALGILGPMDNFGVVSGGALWVFSLLMLLGRLELYTILLLFVPGTWRR